MMIEVEPLEYNNSTVPSASVVEFLTVKLLGIAANAIGKRRSAESKARRKDESLLMNTIAVRDYLF